MTLVASEMHHTRVSRKLNPLWDTTTLMAPQSSGHGHFDIPLPLISLGHFVVMSKCPWTRPDLGAENEVHEVVGHWHRKKIEHLYFLITYLSHSDTISLTHVLTNTRTRTQTHRAASMLNFCVCVFLSAVYVIQGTCLKGRLHHVAKATAQVWCNDRQHTQTRIDIHIHAHTRLCASLVQRLSISLNWLFCFCFYKCMMEHANVSVQNRLVTYKHQSAIHCTHWLVKEWSLQSTPLRTTSALLCW